MLWNIVHFQGCFHVKHLSYIPLIHLPASYIVYSKGHWTSFLILDKKTCLYFDSLGSKVLNPEIITFLSSYSFIKVKCNKMQIQHDSSILCGLYCCLFVALVDSLEAFNCFLSLFHKNNLCSNDEIIMNIINLLK